MGIPTLLVAVLQVYSWLILVRVILSWVNPNPRNELLLMVVKVTEPVLAPLRGILNLGRIDLSPIVALILISVVIRLIH
ncbi:MAG: YggT family protein [bacterium]|nr:YggT family protein [bacterium]